MHASPRLAILYSESLPEALKNIGSLLIGRLSLLTDLLEYSPTALFHKIRGNLEMPESLGATGDVISHIC